MSLAARPVPWPPLAAHMVADRDQPQQSTAGTEFYLFHHPLKKRDGAKAHLGFLFSMGESLRYITSHCAAVLPSLSNVYVNLYTAT